MKTRTRKCKGCGKKFKPKFPKQVFHSVKCYHKQHSKKYHQEHKDEIKIKSHAYYLKNKEHVLKKTKEWKLNNPGKRRRIAKKAMKKYLENNREHFNEMMREYYKRNRGKQLSRTKVYKLLRVYKVKLYKLNKSCFVCDSRYKTWLFFDIYPLTKENILKALKQNKIRYLCRKHWVEASRKRRLKWERKKKREGKK